MANRREPCPHVVPSEPTADTASLPDSNAPTEPFAARTSTARTQAEAKAKAAAAHDRVSRGEPVRDATRTLSDWLAEWRTTFLRASDRAESTKDLYAGLTARHVDPLIGHCRSAR